jgi:hypothetical protein
MRLHRAILGCVILLPLSTLQAQAGNPPSRVGRIGALVGSVSFQPAGATDWSDATLNYTVTTGDRLYSGPGGRAELEVGPMALRLSENADLTLTNLTDHFMQVGAAQGTFRLSVYRLPPGDSIEVDTPNGAVVVSAVGQYRFDVPQNDGFTLVSVDAGLAEVTGPGVDQSLRGGQAVQLSGSDPIQIESVPRPPQADFDRWVADRDRRLGSAGCARYMSRDIPGCADLDESGRWATSPEYGAVWYPARVEVGWVPYRYGRWVWIDPWGWSWVEDEPWGYAPFHYGRWAYIGSAWGWVPGPVAVRPYYAPALVAFVGGSGWSVGVTIGAQAWFPLGPREAYFPSYHHDDVYLREVNVTNVRNVTNVTAFINVRNVETVHYVNRSAGVTVVSSETFRSGRPIAHEVVAVKPEELARATVVAHPVVAPAERATLGGPPSARPPVAARPVMVTTAMPRRDAPVRGGSPTPPPSRVVTKTPPPASTPPVARGGGAPPAGNPAGAPPNQSRGGRPLITKSAPPPETPPFKAREPVMQAHPGKPLEPQQVQNLRGGKPAGPPVDKEVPPHPAATKAPPAKAPPAKEPPRGGGKPDSASRGRGGRGGAL